MFKVSLPTQYNGKNQAPVGGLSSALSRIQSNRDLRQIREKVKDFSKQFPVSIQNLTSKVDEYGRGVFSGKPSTLFEELGLYYIGPVDGHNLDDLLYILKGISRTFLYMCSLDFLYGFLLLLQVYNMSYARSAKNCQVLLQC